MKLKNVKNHSFFYQKNHEAKERITKALKFLVSEVTHGRNDITSIILFGSLGQNEGVWKEKNGRIELISDIDLLVLTKTRGPASKSIKNIVKKAEREYRVKVDLKYIRHTSLLGSVKDTHLFDRKAGVVIWGGDSTGFFPSFQKNDLGLEDADFLFFNRVFLTVESFPINEFEIKKSGAREWISNEAAKTFFTCADLITLFFNEYHLSSCKRIALAKARLREFPLDGNFLKELNKALAFRFHNSKDYYFDDAIEYWMKSKKYLISTFRILHKQQENRNTSIFDEKLFEDRLHLLYRKKYKITAGSYLYYLLRMIKGGRVPRYNTTRPHPLFYRMTSLMLYLSIGRGGVEGEYIKRAEQYISKAYFFSVPLNSNRKGWALLRDELSNIYHAKCF